MSTTTMLDLRRHDLRTNVLENPYWVTSAEFDKDADDLAAVLFSFPAAIYTCGLVLIHEICIEIYTLFAGGTPSIDVGACTILTDDVTTDGDTTDVQNDDYILSADVTEGATAVYWPTQGDWFTAKQANVMGVPAAITPADSAVPCIAAYLTDTTVTAGQARVHMLMSEVPLVNT